MPITPPIFVRGDDLLTFTSVEEAESYLEPVDVEPDELGYDSEGRLLRVIVHGEVRRTGITIDQSRARVELVLAEEIPGHAEELRTVLGDWLARAERLPVSATAGLPDLVERARKLAEAAAVASSVRLRWALTALGFTLLLGVLIWWQANH